MAINSDKIKKEFLRIKSLGFVENVKSDLNDGGAGNTFEYHLGVKENNSKDPDFEGFEVKTKKQLTHSAMSLFTKKPSSGEYDDNYMRNEFGRPDTNYPNVKGLRTSLYAHRFSVVYDRYKMKIEVDRNIKRLKLLVYDLDENLIDDNVYWDFDIIKNASDIKLQNMFAVSAETKKINNKDHFHYTDALVFTGYKGFEHFLNLVDEGVIRYDNRLGVNGPSRGKLAGKPHNHGGGLRINPKDIYRLFDNKVEVD